VSVITHFRKQILMSSNLFIGHIEFRIYRWSCGMHWFELRLGLDCRCNITRLGCVFDLYSFTPHYVLSVLMASGMMNMLIVAPLNVLNGRSHWMYVCDIWDDTTKGVAVVMYFRRVQYHAIILQYYSNTNFSVSWIFQVMSFKPLKPSG